MPVVGSRRVLQTSSEVVLSMKLDDGPLDPNRAISSNDLFTHDEVDRPGIFFSLRFTRDNGIYDRKRARFLSLGLRRSPTEPGL